MATTYRLVTILHGHDQTHSADYWPAGDGCSWSGYVTSFNQYCEDLPSNITSTNCEFYYIDQDAKVKQINNDKSLRKAVESLTDGGVLAITALIISNSIKKAQSSSIGSSSSTKTDIERKESKVQAIVERFSTCYGERCHHSEEVLWSGPCYRYKSDRDYVLSEKCYNDLSKSQKNDWELAAATWDEDAPSAPLYRDSQHSIRDDVRHLQYLLTRLGFMDLKSTDQQTGSYQSHTERAVRKFREHYDIGCSSDEDIEDYSEETKKKLAKVVRKLRSEGHKYL